MSVDVRRVCGPIPVDLWVDLATFVEAWEPEELPWHLVCLGVAPHAKGDDEGEHTRRHLGEIVRCLEEHRDELDERPLNEPIDHLSGEALRGYERLEVDELLRRVREVLALVSPMAKGGDA